MAKLEITGRVYSVGSTISLPSKKDPNKVFYKRELILDTTPFDRYTGQRSEYESYPKFEFRNDNCAKLDTVKFGDVVKVTFDISGRFYTNRDGQQSHMNSVDAFDVEVVRSEQQSTAQPTQQSVAQPAPQPVPSASHPQYPQQAYPQQGYQQPMMQQPYPQYQPQPEPKMPF